jgi:hypothetical protein
MASLYEENDDPFTPFLPFLHTRNPKERMRMKIFLEDCGPYLEERKIVSPILFSCHVLRLIFKFGCESLMLESFKEIFGE